MHQITKTDLGLGMVWADQHCAWTSVPKNANMIMRKTLGLIGLEFVRWDPRRHGQQFSFFIVRDPRTRVLAGISEYRKRHRDQHNYSIQELMERLLVDPLGFDEHLEPQVAFVAGKTYTHILQFESLPTELQRIPYLDQHREIFDRWIKPEHLVKSKRHDMSLDQMYISHQYIVDQLVTKYYGYDLAIWQHPHHWEGRLID